MYKKYLTLLSERGVTTRQVCNAADIPESTMAMWKARYEEWEKSDHTKKSPSPSFETVAKLAKYFEVSTDYFLPEEE